MRASASDGLRQWQGEAEAPGKIKRGQIGFLFGRRDGMNVFVTNEMCPVYRVGARGRAFCIDGAHYFAFSTRCGEISSALHAVIR